MVKYFFLFDYEWRILKILMLIAYCAKIRGLGIRD